MRALIASLALVPSLSAQSKVWVVDAAGGPGFDFTQIQPAVDAASDGDVVLVRTGTYGVLAVAAKSLAIAADAGATVELKSASPAATPYVRVSAIPAGKSVLVEGLRSSGFSGLWSNWPVQGLLCFDSAGSIWVQRCSLRASTYFEWSSFTAGQPALRASSCASLVVRDCWFIGGAGANGPDPPAYGSEGKPGGRGMELLMGTACWAFGSKLHGGQGGWQSAGTSGGPAGGGGGAGASAKGSSLYAAGSALRGGPHGFSWTAYTGYTCSGGAPGFLFDTGLPAAASLAASTVEGGSCGDPSGPAVVGGGVTWFDGPYRGLRAETVLREGESGAIEVFGGPSDLVLLLAASAPSPFVAHAQQGPPLLAPPIHVLASGALSAAGTLSLPYTIQELGAGVEGAVAYLQPLFVEPATSKVAFGAPQAVILLDASF